jgi:hypothetical protein
MIGRKLTERLVTGPLAGRAIERLTLTDVFAPAEPAFSGAVDIVTAELATPGARTSAPSDTVKADDSFYRSAHPGNAGAPLQALPRRRDIAGR